MHTHTHTQTHIYIQMWHPHRLENGLGGGDDLLWRSVAQDGGVQVALDGDVLVAGGVKNGTRLGKLEYEHKGI